MKEYLRLCAKVSVALFCVGHMIAIGLYSIPDEATDPVAQWLSAHVTPRVIPYVLITSQWQQWNLFSPDPLRRIIFYHIEAEYAEDQWTTVASIDQHTYGPWRHAVRFKLLGQALEEDTTRPDLAERAAQVLCGEYGIAAATPIRIWHDIAVIPYVFPAPSKAWWDQWEPRYESFLALETTCQP